MAVRTLAKDSQPVAQAELFHEDVTDALRGAVAAMGGAKVIGSRLFSDLPADAAARRLLDCLNSDRPHSLTPHQFLTVLRWAREAGHHNAMHYLADEAGYTRPSPIEPEDQRAELQRQFIDGVARLEGLAKRLQR